MLNTLVRLLGSAWHGWELPIQEFTLSLWGGVETGITEVELPVQLDSLLALSVDGGRLFLPHF